MTDKKIKMANRKRLGPDYEADAKRSLPVEVGTTAWMAKTRE